MWRVVASGAGPDAGSAVTFSGRLVTSIVTGVSGAVHACETPNGSVYWMVVESFAGPF
jgi:hypothetical protein